MLLAPELDGLSDDLIDTIALAMVEQRRQIERLIPKFCGPHEIGRTYEPHSLVVKGGGLWISLAKTVEPPGTTSWCLVTKSGEVK
jgi:hypothetical protein